MRWVCILNKSLKIIKETEDDWGARQDQHTRYTPPQDNWEPAASGSFQGHQYRLKSGFVSPEFLQILKDIKVLLVAQEIDTSVGQFTKLTQDVITKHCTPKRGHKRLPANFPSNCCFDVECNDSKRKSATSLRRWQHNQMTPLNRICILENQSSWQEIDKYKKRKAIEDLHKRLETARKHNTREFCTAAGELVRIS